MNKKMNLQLFDGTANMAATTDTGLAAEIKEYYVKELLEERFGVTDVRADFIGPVIGAHTGCGTLGLFFVGTQR